MRRALGVDGVEHLLGQPRHELPAHGRDGVAPPPRPGQERRPRVVILPAPVRVHPSRPLRSARLLLPRSPPRLPLAIPSRSCVLLPRPSASVLPPSSSRVGNGKDAPYPRVLRRAVALAPAYKTWAVPGLGGVTQNGHGRGRRTAPAPRDRAADGSDRTARTVGATGVFRFVYAYLYVDIK